MIILNLIIALLLTQALRAAEAPTGLQLTAECQSFIEQIKNQYDYDWIQTPAPSKAASKELNQDIFVFYYYKKSSVIDGQIKNPIVFFNGGPGFSSHGQSQILEAALIKHQIKTELDFIYLDQRGTGCSTPYPVGTDIKVLEKLKWFGSQGIVYDAEAIRQKLLGSRPWKVFGQSFGAQIVYRYIALFPQSIVKAYAHANALNITDEERTYNRIVSQFNVTEAYLKVYPDDRVRLFSLRLKLADKNLCLKNTIRDYCGYEMLTPLVYQIGFKNYWSHLHSWLMLLVPQNSVSDAGLQDYVNRFIRSAAYYSRETSRPHKKTNIALNFLGLYDWNTRPLTFSICEKVYTQMQTQLKINSEAMLLDECKAPYQFHYQDQIEPALLSEWPDLKGDFIQAEYLLEQIKKYKISLYTYSGSLDCFVPKESFVKQNKIFGKSVKYTNFLNTGHDGFYEERKIFEDLALN